MTPIKPPTKHPTNLQLNLQTSHKKPRSHHRSPAVCAIPNDVIFIVDDCKNMTITNCNKLKQHLIDLVYEYNVGSRLTLDTRIGIVTYRRNDVVKLDLKEGTSNTNIRNEILSIDCSTNYFSEHILLMELMVPLERWIAKKESSMKARRNIRNLTIIGHLSNL
ncbi:hypothetical protein RFI_38703 [Reticulomyxa filosa]|uniref:VWFA domain-containing protein n=1 Tax=Reticulomyxa filosa TaxID=46433 RepID=X6LDG5_RETFI|nr:hypothetical protein RFI_38703 [Reticulomyxa filosa]|eukprot:ETN98784.1 hypothetical protein RFI_38703 [Reticulomyxa filosa]